MAGVWTCQRVTAGEKCGTLNGARRRKCERCGKPKPKRKQPAHMKALELPYAAFLAANGGIERCGICGVEPGQRKLHRDHEHAGDGKPRGLLCFPCNLQLKHTSTVEWLRSAADYLERAETLGARAGGGFYCSPCQRYEPCVNCGGS